MRFLTFFLALCLSPFFCFALPLNSNLSEKEMDEVLSGQTLIRNISSYKRICLETDNEEINDYLAELANLNPHYFVEVLQVRKIKEGDRIIDKACEVLSHVEDYTKIDYYSEKHNVTSPLYSYCKILSDETTEDGKLFTVDMKMPPFNIYTAEIALKTDYEKFMLCTSKNLTTMECVGFVRVKENNLRSVVTVFQYEDSWIIYGIGAAKAPKIPILTRGIETAFISRVKSFCGFAISFLDK